MTETKRIFWCQVHDTIGNRWYCAYGDERDNRGLRINCHMVEMQLTPVENAYQIEKPGS